MAQDRQLPDAFEALFGPIAEQLGRDTGFVVRKRCYGAGSFLTALVFGYLHNAQATFQSLAEELHTTASALQQRFQKPQTLLFLQEALKAALQLVITSRPKHLRALKNLNGVYVTDSTTMPLPESLAHLYPSCGGGRNNSAPAAMIKILVTSEVQSGRIHQLTFHAGKDNDNGLPWVEDLPPGCLHLADLGFYNHERLDAENQANHYWISRLPCSAKLRLEDAEKSQIRDLAPFLEACPNSRTIDVPVSVGGVSNDNPLKTRLVAWRCSEAEAEKRRRRILARAKEEKKTVSPAMLAMACWMVYITNAPAEMVGPKQIGELYRVRWQIELLFKRWKSELGLAKPIQKTSVASSLVELHARLLGIAVSEWVGMACGGPLAMPLTSVMQAMTKWSMHLCRLLLTGLGVGDALNEMMRRLESYRPHPDEKTKRCLTRNRLKFKTFFA